MSWFEELTGVREESAEHVRKKIVIEGETIRSLVNGRSFRYGQLETPSLGELRTRVVAADRPAAGSSLREVVGDARSLHRDPANAGALFQVASQFNLLEMVSPSYIPENGVGIYEFDRTQGPACAIAAGAGTIYRSYFAKVNGIKGQSRTNQIDCLDDLGKAFGNDGQRLWEMQNGYALATEDGLREISAQLRSAGEEGVDRFRRLLRIGIQRDTEVTLGGAGHLVSQAFCSALPVGYSVHRAELWEDFARLVLEASYEAVLCAAVLNAARTGDKRVYLTLLGGGVFGNKDVWITDAIERAFRIHENSGLDVAIVSFGSPKEPVRELIARCV